MHLKRRKVPKHWPIKKKGTAYVIRPNSDLLKGIPILIILRDILKVAQNRKEVKKALHEKNILLNNKIVKDEKNSALLLDIITIVPSKKSYRIVLSKSGKFEIEETDEKETGHKFAKVVNKKILKGKKTQLNLSDGKNFISEIKCNINDSVLINLKERKIEKCVPLKEKSLVLVFAGKHIGKKGKINKINKERKMAELECEGNKINILIKQLMVIE